MNDAESKAPGPGRTRFLKRRIVKSDNHGFVGRLYDLGIVSLHFETYDELSRFLDCKYAFDTGLSVKNLATRVESLNLVSDMIWLSKATVSNWQMPVSRYEWLTISADVFLVRAVSVLDCALLLVNEVFQLTLPNRSCTFDRIARKGISPELIDHIQLMLTQQESLRMERNIRVHHGIERPFTDDDTTFRVAALFNDKGQGMIGSDRFRRSINVDLSFREGLVRLQREFNAYVILLEGQLNRFYDLLWNEFEVRFAPLIAKANHDLNANRWATT